jgi:DnaA family protein
VTLLPDIFGISAPPRFANFAPAANRAAFDALIALADGQHKKAVYLWGGAGAGKTHLLRAAVFQAREHSPAFYLPGGESPPPPTNGALLAVDDARKYPPECERDLYQWLEKTTTTSQNDGGARVVAAGDCAPADLPLPLALRTRLGGGLVFRLHIAGENDIRAALADYAARKGFALDNEVADFLLTRRPRALAQLLAAVDDLDRFALAARRPLNLSVAKAWLSQLEKPAANGA